MPCRRRLRAVRSAPVRFFRRAAACGVGELGIAKRLSWSHLRTQWAVLSYYQRFEGLVALVLTLVIALIILVALFRLTSSLVRRACPSRSWHFPVGVRRNSNASNCFGV